MEYFILVADIDGSPPTPPAPSSSRAMRSSPSASTRSSTGWRSQTAPIPMEARAFFGPGIPVMSQLMSPPSVTAAAIESIARDAGASLAFSNLFMPTSAMQMGSNHIPPFTGMDARMLASPAAPTPNGLGMHQGSIAVSQAAATHGQGDRQDGAAGRNTSESRNPSTYNPLEEIFQRAFTHFSAESFISEFMRRTIESQRRGNPPASQFAIENLQEVPAVATESCTVCQDDIVAGSQELRMPCTHSFHKQCLLRWLAEHNTCPVCRCEVESHCPRYNQANFDKLKGKLDVKTISDHEDPSKMDPPATDHFFFQGPPGLGNSSAARTLRMRLRMPVGTLNWLGMDPSSPSTRTQQRSSSHSVRSERVSRARSNVDREAPRGSTLRRHEVAADLAAAAAGSHAEASSRSPRANMNVPPSFRWPTSGPQLDASGGSASGSAPGVGGSSATSSSRRHSKRRRMNAGGAAAGQERETSRQRIEEPVPERHSGRVSPSSIPERERDAQRESNEEDGMPVSARTRHRHAL